MAKVDMNNLPGNSNIERESKAEAQRKVDLRLDRPKQKQIAKVKVRNSPGRKFLKAFIDDDVKDVKGYVLFDVIIPTMKETFYKIVTGAMEMTLWGEVNKASRDNRARRSYVSYDRVSSQQRDIPDRGRRDKDRYQFEEFLFESRDAAEEVLSNMVDLTIDYGECRVSNYLDMVGITSEFTDEYWGWRNLSSASTKRVHGGYIIDLPKPVNLKE